MTSPAPPNVPGPVDLVYVGPDGQVATKIAAYTYLAAPTIDSVVPGLGGVAGDTEVTLIGDNLVPGLQVLFNGIPGQVITVSPPTTATAKTPPSQVAGFIDVEIRNPDGQAGVLTDGFEYLAVPQVSEVWPSTGPNTGGTLIQVRGQNFHPQSRVFFGPNESVTVHYQGPGLLLAFSPVATITLVDIRVENPDGEDASLADAFTYVDPSTLNSPPAITDVFPERGPRTGGTRVSLDGGNLDDDGQAIFIPNPAATEAVRAHTRHRHRAARRRRHGRALLGQPGRPDHPRPGRLHPTWTRASSAASRRSAGSSRTAARPPAARW